jgi:hypothetical protein
LHRRTQRKKGQYIRERKENWEEGRRKNRLVAREARGRRKLNRRRQLNQALRRGRFIHSLQRNKTEARRKIGEVGTTKSNRISASTKNQKERPHFASREQEEKVDSWGQRISLLPWTVATTKYGDN